MNCNSVLIDLKKIKELEVLGLATSSSPTQQHLLLGVDILE